MTIAVDFDGTLVTDEFPNIGKPISSTIHLIKKMQNLGARTILWTCRNGNMLPPAIKWCAEHGLFFDAVNENLPEVQEKWKGDTRKVLADVYIDDKSLGGVSLYELYNLIDKLEKEKSGE